MLLSVKADAAERLRLATTDNSGATLAFVVGDRALMAIVWQGDYGIEDGEMQLSFRSDAVAQGLVRTVERCGDARSPDLPTGITR